MKTFKYVNTFEAFLLLLSKYLGFTQVTVFRYSQYPSELENSCDIKGIRRKDSRPHVPVSLRAGDRKLLVLTPIEASPFLESHPP